MPPCYCSPLGAGRASLLAISCAIRGSNVRWIRVATESNCAIEFVGTIVGISVAILLLNLDSFEIYFDFTDSILYCVT